MISPKIPLFLGLLLTSPVLFAEDYPTANDRAKWVLQKGAEGSPAEVAAWAKRIGLGDPHKYLLPVVIAEVDQDATDAGTWEGMEFLMGDEKQRAKPGRGLYHFSAFNTARLYFGYRDKLPDSIGEWMDRNTSGRLGVFRAGGTENHGMMSRTSGYLFAEKFQKPGATGKGDHLKYFRDFLRRECKKLYMIGMGEWDSSIYLAFTMSSWLNVLDYTKDDKIRELAHAAVDWYATALAIKYFHGVMIGPESRGFARGPGKSHADLIGWIWWGGLPGGRAPDVKPAGVRYAVIPAASSYRPDEVIGNLARKSVKLPFEIRGSKPSYYGYTKSNVFQEVGYYTDTLAMGTLYDSYPGDKKSGTIWPQTTQFQLGLLTADDVLVMGVANPYHHYFPVSGRSPYDQYHQSKGTMLNVCYVPEGGRNERTVERSLLGVQEGIQIAGNEKGWWFFTAGRNYIAARPLGKEPKWITSEAWRERIGKKGKKGKVSSLDKDWKWLASDGALTGWIIDTGSAAEFSNLDDFKKAVLQPGRLNLKDFESNRKVSYKSLYGETLEITHTGGPGGRPEATIDGRELKFEDWPVFESPYVNEALNSGVLQVSDGKEQLTIDFSGEWPVRSKTPLGGQ